jgi:hypothetical protein
MLLETNIRIDATAERIWSVLIDLPRYAEWNPFIIEASGVVEQDARISAFIRPPGQKGMRFKPRLLTVEPARCLRWRGSVLFPGLFDGTHVFRIEPVGTSACDLLQSESFSGILAPLVTGGGFRDSVLAGFSAMNAALKARAESQL